MGWQILNFGLGGTTAHITYVFVLKRPACWGDVFLRALSKVMGFHVIGNLGALICVPFTAVLSISRISLLWMNDHRPSAYICRGLTSFAASHMVAKLCSSKQTTGILGCMRTVAVLVTALERLEPSWHVDLENVHHFFFHLTKTNESKTAPIQPGPSKDATIEKPSLLNDNRFAEVSKRPHLR